MLASLTLTLNVPEWAVTTLRVVGGLGVVVVVLLAIFGAGMLWVFRKGFWY